MLPAAHSCVSDPAESEVKGASPRFKGVSLAYLGCRQPMLAGGTSRQPAVLWWCELRNAQW